MLQMGELGFDVCLDSVEFDVELLEFRASMDGVTLLRVVHFLNLVSFLEEHYRTFRAVLQALVFCRVRDSVFGLY